MNKALVFEVSKALEAGADAKDLKHGIDAAVDIVVAYFKRTARMVHTPKEIAQVATALTNGDSELGNFIAKGMEKVGKDSFPMIARHNELNNEVEFVNAVNLRDWSFYSQFIFYHSIFSPKRKKIFVLKNPLVLVIVDKILNKNVVEAVQQTMRPAFRRRPLLIIAEELKRGVDHHPDNKKLFITGFRWGKDKYWRLFFEDLAILTGGQVVTGESDMNCIPQMLGSCKEIRISYDKVFIFVRPAGDQKDIEKRCEQLRCAIELSEQPYLLKERLAFLSQTIMFKVGGDSRYKKVKYAAQATKMAMNLGILPGGGVALLNASKELDKLQTKNSDEKLGVQLLQSALKMPVYTIASAAGFDGSVAVEKLMEQDNPELGYDPATGDYIEMFKSGNIDVVDLLTFELNAVIRRSLKDSGICPTLAD